MITLTSTELNYLIFRYLVDEGYAHSAYVFGRESLIEDNPNTPEVEHNALKQYVSKGIEMEYIARHSENGRLKRCTAKYSISHYHKCTDQSLEIYPTYLETHNSDVSLCAWSEEGELVTGSQNCMLRLWSPPSIKGEWQLGQNESSTHGITGLAIESSSRLIDERPGTVVVGATHNGDLFVGKHGRDWRILQAHKGPIVALSLREASVVSGGWDGLCKEWIFNGDKLVENDRWVLHKGPVMDILSFPTGFVTCSVDTTLCTVDKEGAPVKMIGHTGEVNSIKRIGTSIVSCSDDGTLKIWKYGVAMPVETLTGHSKEVYSVATSYPHIASGSFDADVRIWECERGSLTAVLQGHTKAIYTVAFSPDGSLLASGGLDSTVRIWDTRSNGLAKEFLVGSGIYQVEFSPHNTTLAVCSSDPRPIVLDLRR
ncbi:transducin (beta)-like 1 [Nematocida displodere]|uniref:Transducin (Beta)-like 1 n=1 Tax=Nematocida displodere TaxID=1805483 RepID=A0A177ECP1_9MICR|nr:transducin (beta)-like 1 [Nematocida displodere]